MSADEELGEAIAAEAAAPPEEASTTETPTSRRKGGRIFAALLGLVIVGSLGFAGAWYDVLKLRGADPVQRLQAEIDALATLLADSHTALSKRIVVAEAALKTAPEAEQAAQALAARVGAIEMAMDALSKVPANADGSVSAAGFAALATAVEALKSDVAALKATPSVAAEADIRAAVARAMTDWTADQAARAQADGDAAKVRAATLEAIQSIRAAALTGAPYADALAALQGVEVDDLIRSHGDTGLPTLADLSGSFPEAARLALEASLRAAGGGGLSDRMLNFLRIQTGARSLEPREGDDPDAVLSRAEAAVGTGDVTAALAEVARLPAEGQAEMAVWVAQANDYLAAKKALAALAASVGL